MKKESRYNRNKLDKYDVISNVTNVLYNLNLLSVNATVSVNNYCYNKVKEEQLKK